MKRTIDIVIKIRSANRFLFFTSSRILPLVFYRSVNTYRISSTCLYTFAYQAEEKSRSLKFPMQVPGMARGDIGKAIEAFSSTRRHSAGTGRNIRTQFLYDNSIYPVSGRAECISFVVTRGAGRTYLTYRHPQWSSRTFYSANGGTLFAHIARNSRAR